MKNKINHPLLKEGLILHKNNSLQKAPKQFEQVINHLNPEKKTKILEIGCGEGLTVAMLNLNGFDGYGIDPDESYIKNAQQVLEYNKIDKNKVQKGSSERLPFQDEEFDCVVSFQVLEHVDDVLSTFQEIERVLKKGGGTINFAPSYHSFREGHFHVPMLPFMNKKMFYYWLKLINLIPNKKIKFSYLEHLNFLNPKMLENDYFPLLKELELKEIAGDILKKRTKEEGTIFSNKKEQKRKLTLLNKIFYFLEKIYLGKFFILLIIKLRIYPQLVIYGEKQ